jgi:farnesyl-diphosphate farnesyltransferase
MRSKNPREVGLIFREHARRIHAKAVPSDPNFIRISVACGKVRSFAELTHLKFLITLAPCQIEAWFEQNYPSFIQLSSEPGKQSIDVTDARAKIVIADQTFDEELRKRKIIQNKNGSVNGKELPGIRVDDLKDNSVSLGWMTLYAAGAFSLILVICTGLVWALVRYTEKS